MTFALFSPNLYSGYTMTSRHRVRKEMCQERILARNFGERQAVKTPQTTRQIESFVEAAYGAQLLRSSCERDKKKAALTEQLAVKGSRLCGVYSAGIIEIEDEYIASLLHAKADLYIQAHQRQGVRIDPAVLHNLSITQSSLLETRRFCLTQAKQLDALRARSAGNALPVHMLGQKTSIAAKEIEAKIKLFNMTSMTPPTPSPTTINVSYHLSGPNNRINNGSVDSSTNTVDQREVLQKLTEAIVQSVQDSREQSNILQALTALQGETSKCGYLEKITKFVSAAASIGHIIGPYLPALIKKAESLL